MIRPLVFVWPYAAPFWVLFAVVFLPELLLERQARAMATADQPQDRGSVRVIIIAGRTAVGLAIAIALVLPGATVNRARGLVFVAGLLFLGVGELLRWHGRRMLGRYFTGTVRVLPGQPVITSGAYRWVRHPAYTGAIMIMVGIGLALTNWVSLLILAVLPATAYAVRVRAEEAALLETIGEPYRAYMRHTKRFVPYVF